MKTLAITGFTGFVGSSLKKSFESQGFRIMGIQRKDLQNKQTLIDIMEESDYVINLAGANIIQRWTASYKELLYSSRIETTKALVQAMKEAKSKPEVFISTSAVGIYKNEMCYDEGFYAYEEDFLANLCKEWEKEALNAQIHEIRTVIFRFGIVMGKGGALQKMLTPFKLGVGGTIGDGSQYFSFVHMEDLLNAYRFVFDNESCEGVYNLTAPVPTTNSGLTQALGQSLNRPTVLPVPAFVLKLIFGEGSKVLTDGQCAKPQRLIDAGFKFKFETIEETIANLISKRRSS
jgi:uncharacterized protein (TIGR01777 family)